MLYAYISVQNIYVRNITQTQLKRSIFNVFYQDNKPNLFRAKLLKTVFASLPVASDDLIYLKVRSTHWRPGFITLEGLLSSPEIGLHCVEFNLSEASFMNWEMVGSVKEILSKDQRCFNEKGFLARFAFGDGLVEKFDLTSFTIERESMTVNGTLEIQGYLQANFIQSYTILLSRQNGAWVRSAVATAPTVYP